MSTDRSSLERAIASEFAEDAMIGAAVDVEQLEMLRDDTGKLPDNVFRLARSGAAERGRGRPAGSLNRRNDALAKLIVHQHGDPVLAMASLYSRPIDQLAELLMIADGSREREQAMALLADRLQASVERLLAAANLSAKQIDALSKLTDRLIEVARTLRSKPGDLGIKALNVQLMAARSVAEYVHSKKPVEANVNVRSDGVIVMPAIPAMASVGEKDAIVRQAADGIAKMLADGAIDAEQLAQYRFVDGQFVDAEFVEVDEGPSE